MLQYVLPRTGTYKDLDGPDMLHRRLYHRITTRRQHVLALQELRQKLVEVYDSASLQVYQPSDRRFVAYNRVRRKLRKVCMSVLQFRIKRLLAEYKFG